MLLHPWPMKVSEMRLTGFWNKHVMRIGSWIIGFALYVLISTGFADTPRTGVAFSIPVISKDPEYLHAYQLTGWYQPALLLRKDARVYFTVSAGHWWVTNTNHNHSMNIYSVSPILQFYFWNNPYFSPFLNFGFGAAYLSRTRLGDSNHGMHFAFQDQLGLGASVGKKRQFSVILSALHYSNGSLCSVNSDITVPLMLSVQYASG